MIKINYYVRPVSNEEKIPIYVRVSNGRAFDLKVRTKETCYLSLWDIENGMMKEKLYSEEKGRLVEKRDADTRASLLQNKLINSRLRDLESKIESSFKENVGIIFNTNWLKSIIEPPIIEGNKIPDDFIKYCDLFIEQKGNNISKRYVEKIEAIKKIITELLIQKKKRVLKFDEINLKFGVDFENLIIDGKPFSKNYIERNIKFIKTIAYHAESNGIILHSQIKKLKAKGEKTTFQILSIDELEKFENVNFDDEHLNNVRDWLIISAYCGQRVSDFMRFNKTMISILPDENEKVRYFFGFYTRKNKSDASSSNSSQNHNNFRKKKF